MLLLMLVFPLFLPSLVHSVFHLYHALNVSKSPSGMEALACNRLEELPAGVTAVGR